MDSTLNSTRNRTVDDLDNEIEDNANERVNGSIDETELADYSSEYGIETTENSESGEVVHKTQGTTTEELHSITEEPHHNIVDTGIADLLRSQGFLDHIGKFTWYYSIFGISTRGSYFFQKKLA